MTYPCELTNEEKYEAMMDAVNKFYWDNSISPNETAAKLETFAGEVSRLAKFILGNASFLDSAAKLMSAPVQSGDWTCDKCKAVNRDGISNCSFCDTPRFGG